MKISISGPPKEFLELRERLLMEIDMKIGAVRSKYITTIPGQEMTYMEKRREADTILAKIAAEETISENDYPMLKTESEAENVSIVDKATEVQNTAAQWININTILENIRLSTKKAVNDPSIKTNGELLTAAEMDLSAF